MKKKYSNSRLRRSKRGKSAKNGRRLRIKTRRMRGKGWFDGLFGSARPAESAEPAGYNQAPQEEEKIFVENNVMYKDGKKEATYTGYILNLGGAYVTEDDNAVVNYVNGSTYIGGFKNNMKNGKGTFYSKHLELSGDWVNNKPTGIMREIIYNDDGTVKSDGPRMF